MPKGFQKIDESAARFYLRLALAQDERPRVRSLMAPDRPEAVPDQRLTGNQQVPNSTNRLVHFGLSSKSRLRDGDTAWAVRLASAVPCSTTSWTPTTARRIASIASTPPTRMRAGAAAKVGDNGASLEASCDPPGSSPSPPLP